MTSRLSRLLGRTSRLFPVRLHFILFAALLLAGAWYLRRVSSEPDSSYRDITVLLLKTTLLLSVVLVAAGLITVLVPFVYLAIRRRQGRVEVKIESAAEGSSQSTEPLRTIAIVIHPFMRPLFGFTKLRVQEGDELSPKLLLRERSRRVWSFRANGYFYRELPHLGRYALRETVIHFEDLFMFFSLPLSLATSGEIFLLPGNPPMKEATAAPRRNEDSSIRIEELKKTEGEYLNYKNFESSDDVRRIVWKIYAKSGELVVRIPEILDPYASELYLYVSFNAPHEMLLSHEASLTLLDHYKQSAWSCYQALRDKGFEVRYLSDQSDATAGKADIQKPEEVRRLIAESAWQDERTLQSAGASGMRDISVLMVSPFNDANEIRSWLDAGDVTVIFTALSLAMAEKVKTGFLEQVFMKRGRRGISRWAWKAMPGRVRLEKQEREISKLVSSYSKGVSIA